MSDIDLILSNVEKHVALNESEKDLFVSFLERKSLSKRTIVLKAGEVCRYSTFVVDGALRSYSVDKSSDEHVISFAVKDWWIADMYSLISQKPAILTIEAIADSEVLLLSKQNQELLYEKVPKFERFFRILTENSLVANQQRIINNLTLTAEERYLHFMKKYPFVLECAPLHNIASYLGMTPEFLSKIRRRLAGKLN
jgi:CRP-like cAMP-binding protein